MCRDFVLVVFDIINIKYFPPGKFLGRAFVPPCTLISCFLSYGVQLASDSNYPGWAIYVRLCCTWPGASIACFVTWLFLPQAKKQFCCFHRISNSFLQIALLSVVKVALVSLHPQWRLKHALSLRHSWACHVLFVLENINPRCCYITHIMTWKFLWIISQLLS